MAALQCEICGGKLIGRPGGMFECDSCGMEYDTAWAKAKIQEIRGTVQVEGTVEVKGSVKVDGTVKVEGGVSVQSLLKRIRICAQDREAARIRELAEQILNIEPECGEAYLWLLLVEKKVYQLDDLFRNSLRNLEELAGHKHWKNALTYLPEEQSRQLDQKLADAMAQWLREDPQVVQRNRQIRPAQGLIHDFYSGGIAALRSDGKVYVTYNESKKWLAPASRWSGIQKLVSNRFGLLMGICWDGTVCAVCDNEKTYKNMLSEICGWQNIKDLAVLDDNDYDVVVGLRTDGTLVSAWLDPYQGEGRFAYYVRRGEDVYFALEAAGWTDVCQMNVIYLTGGTVNARKDACVFVLGITQTGELRVSDISRVPDMARFWKGYNRVDQWKNMEKHCWGWTYQLRDGSSWNLITGNKFSDIPYMDYPIYKGGVTDIGIASHNQEIRDVVACSYHAAILADGSLVAGNSTGRAVATVRGEEWKNMVALAECSAGDSLILGVREDGVVLHAWFKKPEEGVDVEGWRLFDSLETLEEERENARVRTLEEIAQRKRRMEEAARRKEEAARRRAEEEKRIRAEEERRRLETIASLERERSQLQTELGELRGLFTGRRRRAIETRLTEIDQERMRLRK